MIIKKAHLLEVVDTHGNLIGDKAIPDVDANADTQANNTSDYNQKIGTQPFRYDMLGRFGFTLMPFMEGKENLEQTALLQELINLMYDRYKEILEYYYKNPNKLKSDYRRLTSENIDPQKDDNVKYAYNIIKVLEKHMDDSLKTLDEQFKENIAESIVIEDKMVDKKEDEITNKSDNKEVREKKIEKIAGLINKLEKKDIDKIINLLERDNG